MNESKEQAAMTEEQDQAYRMVGGAIVAGIQLALHQPVLDPEIRAVVRWLSDWLPVPEKELLARYTGVDFGNSAPPPAPFTDAERYGGDMQERIRHAVGRAIILRIRHTETDRANDPDILAVVHWLDETCTRAQKDFIALHAPIDFDAPGRPLPPFTAFEPPF
jgi:hypothetical protein